MGVLWKIALGSSTTTYNTFLKILIGGETTHTAGSIYFFYKKLKNVSCEYDRVNGWNSTFASCVVHQTFTQIIVRACSMFYPYEGHRSVTPLDAARFNRTIFHNHSVHWYYITLIKGRYYKGASRRAALAARRFCLLYTSDAADE